MKKYVKTGIILFVFFVAVYVYINISQINNNIAVSDFNSGNYENALNYFKRAAVFKNKEDIIKYNLANTNTRMYDYETAKKMYLELLDKQELSNELKSEIYFNLGNIECMYENFYEALEYYYIALTINPEDKDIKYNIELVEYLNRPIIYNNEILLLPKQKLSEQISLMEKEGTFKDKLSENLDSNIINIYDTYTKFSDSEVLTHKQINKLNAVKKLNIQKALIKFNDLSNEYMNVLSANDDKEIQGKLKKIKESIIKNNKVIENFEQLKLRIIKGINTREKLAKLLSGIKYKDGLQEVVLLEQYNPLNSENDEKNISIIERDCIHQLNQAQYYSFLEQNYEVLDELNNIIKISINNSRSDAAKIKNQILQIIRVIVFNYVNNMMSNSSTFDEYLSISQNYDNEIFKELKNSSLNEFIVELKNSKKYDLTYEKILFYFKELYKYSTNVSNIHLLMDSLIERDLYNISCIEYTQNILEQNNLLSSKDIMEIYKFLNVILSASLEYRTKNKEQKQAYEAIERDNSVNIDTIIKILSLKFYINSINMNNKDFININKNFGDFLEQFNEKEESAQKTKKNMKELAKEIKEISGEIISVEDNKHMYANVEQATQTLKTKQKIKEDNLKEAEIDLIKSIKFFIDDFIPKLSQQVFELKKDIKNFDSLLKKVVSVDEFEQRIAKEKFLVENKDLDVELNNFEQNKKFLFNLGSTKNIDDLYNTDSLVSKSIYQKQKLEDILIEEKKISEQIEKLKSSSDILLKSEKQELDMLEKDLVDKQLSLVKYYITIENDNMKKSMTRQLMQSLYKEKYNTEKNDNVSDLDLENFEYSNFRDSILILYKAYMFQLRELNKFVFRLKVINSVLELEIASKLNERIEFDKQYFDGKNVKKLKSELETLKALKVRKNEQEMKEIIEIFKENMSSAKELQERLIEYQKKQQKMKEEDKNRQQQNLSRKIAILNNKIDLLEEHIKYNDEQVNTKEDIDRMKEEIELTKKEKEQFVKQANKLKKLNTKDDTLNIEKVMESIVQSADVILDGIDKNGKRTNEHISRSDVQRMLYMQSNKDNSVQKENKTQSQKVQNDW